MKIGGKCRRDIPSGRTVVLWAIFVGCLFGVVRVHTADRGIMMFWHTCTTCNISGVLILSKTQNVPRGIDERKGLPHDIAILTGACLRTINWVSTSLFILVIRFSSSYFGNKKPHGELIVRVTAEFTVLNNRSCSFRKKRTNLSYFSQAKGRGKSSCETFCRRMLHAFRRHFRRCFFIFKTTTPSERKLHLDAWEFHTYHYEG